MIKAEAVINLNAEQQAQIAPLVKEAVMWNGQVLCLIERDHPSDVKAAVIRADKVAAIKEILNG